MTEKEAKARLAVIVEHIQQCKRDCLANCIEIGFELQELKESSIWVNIRSKNDTSYCSAYELIEEYFGMSKATVSYYIGVARRYADPVSRLVKPKYKDYSFSQLREMLSLTDSQILKCNPTMTCEAIHDIKKSDKGSVKETTFVPDPNSSLQLHMTKELYDKVLARANRCQKQMENFVIEVLELYFKGLTD